MLRLLLLATIGLGLTAAAWEVTRPTSAGGSLYGDANCDQTVNSIDAAVLLQHSAGLLKELGCPGFADVNGDHMANSLDAALVLQFVAGLIPDLDPNPVPTPTASGTPQQCPDGYYWNPAKGHCDSRECPPGFYFDEATLYCLPNPTPTPVPGGTPVQHKPFYYNPAFWWSDTDVDVTTGQRIDVLATGSVIYDNFHLGGVTADGDGDPTGWGPCPDHSLLGYVGPTRPAENAPLELSPVICLGAGFSGMMPASGNLYVSINDRSGFDNNVGQWYVTVTTY